MVLEEFLQEADERLDRKSIEEIQEFLESLEVEYIEKFIDNEEVLAYIYYTKANHLSELLRLQYSDKEFSNKEEISEQTIYSLRLAIEYGSRSKLDKRFMAMILTNLANELDNNGRFVEAIETWNKVEKDLGILFPMAKGNKGLGLIFYAGFLYDEGHAHFLRRVAHKNLKYSSSIQGGVHPEAKRIFENNIETLESFYSEEFLNHFHEHPAPDYGEDEKSYRKWCLDNILFINPLNDATENWICDTDVFGLPSITVPIDETYPVYHSYFNQLKQEYVSARWLLFESTLERSHFSDKEVLMYNTLDYQAFGLSTQKVRLAFKSIYSIFDKISYFLNEYFNIGLDDRAISFKSIWYKNIRASRLQIRDGINIENNSPLKGLYWLSKDLFYKGDLEYRAVIEPDAKDLDIIRNKLEHKFISVYDSAFVGNSVDDGITDGELFNKTLKLMKLSRAALIYLSLSVHKEEQIKTNSRDKFALPINIPLFEDEWKN
ncbi:LA2681 family HEPN domain-containing protein [Metabacillus hrfriensis]|uniref:LA2681 family HEPN domain-containing protein n=1 Tax=Metabacillus hrfriensis TaxID=3048891 RepID=A0ACD4RHP5_9BACI|nr:LA2681 family HEPN domain-containing protein [Metabacillus sp. CT-WN-B3]WHZ60035.1 LA2681 family HEPN domain-containing protein [Metabacillus sp. CT-WN-B3]